MPIDPAKAIGAVLPQTTISWTSSDVMLYHLAIGAGAKPTDPRELRYVLETDLQVLPTFADVAQLLRRTSPPDFNYPGMDIDLKNVLHGAEILEVHRPVPTDADATVTTRVADVWDKGSAAVLVIENVVSTEDGPLWTMTSQTFIRNEGGFGGSRGESRPPSATEADADEIFVSPTLPQQALLYRLLGDRNPLHSDPESAKSSGFPAPILHGRASFGIVCKALVDGLLDGDATRIQAIRGRFSSVVFPGETLRTEVWRDGQLVRARVSVAERDAVVLDDVELRHS